MFAKVIRGKNCSLVRFKNGDEKLVSMIYNLFNEKEIEEYLNPEYLNYKTKSKIRKWIQNKTDNPVEVWFVIVSNRNYAGYVCFKWRVHYNEACEISTAIDRQYRGLKLGFESSKLLIDYIKQLRMFKYIVGYVHKDNMKAANNLKKVGFRLATRLGKIVTMQFYNEDGTSSTGQKYHLYAIYEKKK